MFRRKSNESTGTSDAEVEAAAVAGGKGRPTPTRREAEAARKTRMTVPKNRKDAAKQLRQKRYEERLRARQAMDNGDERYLPARDRGPVRRYCRDVVDGRINAAEFLLPVLVVILLVSFISNPAIQQSVLLAWFVIILVTAVDTVFLVRRLRRELRDTFGDVKRPTSYAVLRSTQMRRFRLPKPGIARGEAPR